MIFFEGLGWSGGLGGYGRFQEVTGGFEKFLEARKIPGCSGRFREARRVQETWDVPGGPGGSRRPGRSERSGRPGRFQETREVPGGQRGLRGQGGPEHSGRPGRFQEAREVRETQDVLGGQGGLGGPRGRLHIIMAAILVPKIEICLNYQNMLVKFTSSFLFYRKLAQIITY